MTSTATQTYQVPWQITIAGVDFSLSESRLLMNKLYEIAEDIEDTQWIAQHDPQTSTYHNADILDTKKLEYA